MSENSLRSVLERDWVTQLDDLCATLAYHQVPFKDRAEAFEKFMNRYRAALTATQEPQRGDIAVSIVTDVHHDWDESGTLSGETLRRIANFRERAAGAPAASGRSPLLHEASTHKPPGCYCPPNDCQAPRIMGRQVPCSRPCDTYTEMCKPGSSVKLRYNCVLPKNHTKPHAFAGEAAAPRPELAPATHVLGEDVWLDELLGCTNRDQRRTWLRAFAANLKTHWKLKLEREAPPDLAGALERLVAKWRKQAQNLRDGGSGFMPDPHSYRAVIKDEMADELAAQLKVAAMNKEESLRDPETCWHVFLRKQTGPLDGGPAKSTRYRCEECGAFLMAAPYVVEVTIGPKA